MIHGVSMRRGFSLMEIMIAVAIMGLLAAVAGPAVMGYLKKAKVSSAKTTIRAFESAILEYYTDTGNYPETLDELVSPPNDPKIAAKWQEGGYLKSKKIPKDPWNHNYVYELTPDEEDPYELYSYGPKGKKAKEAERISVREE